VDWVDTTAVDGAKAAIGLCTRWDSKATSPAPSLLPLPLNTIEDTPRSSVGGDSTTQSSGWESVAWSEKKIPESLDGEGGTENKTLDEIHLHIAIPLSCRHPQGGTWICRKPRGTM